MRLFLHGKSEPSKLREQLATIRKNHHVTITTVLVSSWEFSGHSALDNEVAEFLLQTQQCMSTRRLEHVSLLNCRIRERDHGETKHETTTTQNAFLLLETLLQSTRSLTIRQPSSRSQLPLPNLSIHTRYLGLESLELQGVALNHVLIRQLQMFLTKSPNLQGLVLSNAPWTMQEVQYLQASLLGRNAEEAQHVLPLFCEMISSSIPTTLKSLELSNGYMEDTLLAAILKEVSKSNCRRILNLNISGNLAGEETFDVLGQRFLCHENSQLQSLDVSWQQLPRRVSPPPSSSSSPPNRRHHHAGGVLSPGMMQSLTRGLQHNQTLQSLRLGRNVMESSTFQQLVKTTHSSKLRRLDLQDCELRREAMEFLFQRRLPPFLESLNISGHQRFTAADMAPWLRSALSRHLVLKRLDLPHGFEELFDEWEFFLQCNRIGRDHLQDKHALPAPLWPRLLERANVSCQCYPDTSLTTVRQAASSIFHLLRDQGGYHALVEHQTIPTSTRNTRSDDDSSALSSPRRRGTQERGTDSPPCLITPETIRSEVQQETGEVELQLILPHKYDDNIDDDDCYDDLPSASSFEKPRVTKLQEPRKPSQPSPHLLRPQLLTPTRSSTTSSCVTLSTRIITPTTGKENRRDLAWMGAAPRLLVSE